MDAVDSDVSAQSAVSAAFGRAFFCFRREGRKVTSNDHSASQDERYSPAPEYNGRSVSGKGTGGEGNSRTCAPVSRSVSKFNCGN